MTKPFTTLVIGASTNAQRYSFKAVTKLTLHGFNVVALGNKPGKIGPVEIVTHRPEAIPHLGVVTLYINPEIQKDYYQYIIDLLPEKVIFNPGTENPEFARILEKKGIKTEEACTLVLLSLNQFNAQ